MELHDIIIAWNKKLEYISKQFSVITYSSFPPNKIDCMLNDSSWCNQTTSQAPKKTNEKACGFSHIYLKSCSKPPTFRKLITPAVLCYLQNEFIYTITNITVIKFVSLFPPLMHTDTHAHTDTHTHMHSRMVKTSLCTSECDKRDPLLQHKCMYHIYFAWVGSHS